ncbi:Ig-like domain-containing protein [candidate division KSB1 bacterium]|nr:Ig-like domain-containing protein [candidate division KSB1 bacterium]
MEIKKHLHTATKTINLIVFLSITFCSLAFSRTGENDLTRKLMMGYQGWFLCQGDGSPVNDWRHWFHHSNDPSIEQINIDNWPDLSEYTNMYPTNMKYRNGSTVSLFSSHDESTTMIHFKWMQDYNIYGIYLQRFLGEAVGDSRFFRVRNHVLENVINASKVYDRHFALMYDITGVPEEGLYEKLVNDWEYLVDTYDMLNEENYVKQNGLPVVAIWGMGFPHNEVTAETAMDIIDYFHREAAVKYQSYIMGGVPGRWRTLDGDSKPEPLWADAYRALDMLSPWTVGRYNKSSVDNWKNERIIPDLAECTANVVDYMPVIFPGGSWFNLSGYIDSTRINDNPRDGGNFYWRQAYNAISAGVQFLYVAMFDEVDEGTAMFKLATNDDALPDKGTFVPLDEDGYELPSDWYLQLADKSQKMLDQTIALTSQIPITPPKIPVTGITVTPIHAIMATGGTLQLSAKIEPGKAYDKSVTWNSSDDNVASVPEKGKVFAKIPGNAIITATTMDGGYKAECNLTVKEGKPVTGITLSPANVEIRVGNSQQLTAVIEPPDALVKNVQWRSGDRDIAVVDTTGLVTAMAEGKTTITAITQDGGKRANSRITVVDPSQLPFWDVPHTIPGIIEAEDYDIGGEGVAYHDADVTNNGGQYRTDEAVDIETCSEGGYSLGWFNSGEWVEYTVNVTQGGRYDVFIAVATQLNGAKFHIEFNGANRSGTINVPNTGGWQTWEEIVKTRMLLVESEQVMRVFRETDGADFNIDYFEFSVPDFIDNIITPVTKSPQLYPAYPNPFNAAATIYFETTRLSNTQLVIYDILGREIKKLVDERLESGVFSRHWDSKDNQNRPVPSGVYFARMQTGNFAQVIKLLLLR